MAEVTPRPGWLSRDVRRAAQVVLKNDIQEAERHIRTLNADLADACSRLTELKTELRRLERANITLTEQK